MMIDRVALVTAATNSSPPNIITNGWGGHSGRNSSSNSNNNNNNMTTGGGGGGGMGLSPASSSVLTSMESMDSLEGFESESGFIGSRPSMADFIPNPLTSGGYCGDVGVVNNGIGSGGGGGVSLHPMTPGTPTGSSMYCGNQPGSGGNAAGGNGIASGGGGSGQQQASNNGRHFSNVYRAF